jgi:hypothetical protein
VNDRVPVITVSRRGRSVRFAAVIEPVQKPASPQVRDVTLARNGKDLTATVVMKVKTSPDRPEGAVETVNRHQVTTKYDYGR